MKTLSTRRVHQIAARILTIADTASVVAVAAMAATLLLPGCGPSSAPMGKFSNPFSQNKIEESTRKQANSDPFPTAQQAGLAKSSTGKRGAAED